MIFNSYRCKMAITLCTADSKEIRYKEGTLIWYTRFNLNGTLYIRICSECGVSDFPDFNIEDLVEPLEGVEKELADVFINTVEQTNKVIESFNPVPPTKEQKERLEKLCDGLVKHEPTTIDNMKEFNFQVTITTDDEEENTYHLIHQLINILTTSKLKYVSLSVKEKKQDYEGSW